MDSFFWLKDDLILLILCINIFICTLRNLLGTNSKTQNLPFISTTGSER